ncbi:MAG: hypothetical protein ACOY3F_08050 [Bacillota bacterium]
MNPMSRPPGDLKVVVLFIDGIEVAGYTVVVAMGLKTGARKYGFGLWGGRQRMLPYARRCFPT